jgi:predicted HAD superfamily Cof-like phosphohydrolase
MRSEQNKVKDFHAAFDIPIIGKPTIPNKDVKMRRISLINEECSELFAAMHWEDLVSIADGIADLLYVVLGTAVEYGIDIEPIFNEVHRSNMTKFGGTKREDGKWLKPETYSPANIKRLIDAQKGL